MDFRVRFYETVAGDKPLAEFLRELQTERPSLHRLVLNGIAGLCDRRYHGPPPTKRVVSTKGLYELRVGRSEIARVYFFFRPGQEIICTSGYVKKSQRLDSKEIQRAAGYQADWEARNP